MKTLRFLILSLLGVSLNAATSWTEFYCQSTGANTNAGSTTGAAAVFSAINGNWTNTTGVFFKSGLNPEATVAVGDWAAIYDDGAAVAAFVGRVTARSDADDTITLSLTAFAGTNPADDVATTSISVGGAWRGPNSAEDFPFDFAAATMTNASGNVPRINFKNDADYEITAAMTHTLTGPIRFQGYTATPGDLGKATFKAITTTASYVMMTMSGTYNEFSDAIFWGDSFTSGTSLGFTVSGVRGALRRIVAHDMRGYGISISANSGYLEECETYACNESNTATYAGIILGVINSVAVRCISHDNVTANGNGFSITAASTLINCIADSNATNGFRFSGNAAPLILYGCDSYNNGGDGLDLTSATVAGAIVQNSNFVGNSNYGINSSGGASRSGSILNCGFGSGTEANTAGNIAANAVALEEIGSVTYGANLTPWVDPANGDFRITLTAAKGTGRGSFTETAAGYSGTVGYPDIGAAQHLESAGSGPTSHVWAQ